MNELLAFFKGNQAAVQFLAMLQEVSHTWDDLIDKDTPTTPEGINRALWIALVGLNTNEFYQLHSHDLLPVMEVGIFNYIASIELERTPGHPRHLAHTARYQIGDIAMVMCRIIGGVDWAMEQAPALKLFLQTDTFEHFNAEMEQRHGT